MRSYSEDFREAVVKKYKSGISRKEVLAIFSIGSDTLTRWMSMYRDTGNLSPKERGRYSPRKFSDKDLLSYIDSNSDSTLEEIAEKLDVSHQAIWQRLKILGITRKKNHGLQRTKSGKRSAVQELDK